MYHSRKSDRAVHKDKGQLQVWGRLEGGRTGTTFSAWAGRQLGALDWAAAETLGGVQPAPLLPSEIIGQLDRLRVGCPRSFVWQGGRPNADPSWRTGADATREPEP